MKTLRMPEGLDEKCVQYFLNGNYSLGYFDEEIETCKKKKDYEKIVKQWEYIKQRWKQKNFRFIFR
jgi:1-aminocyclopropane-1-carboxylate deaminase/D-cysteine desulfhydrase-like pyridoxal-dependent ACC family enzyme